MATSISVPGANHVPPLVFTVSGTSLTNYALAFQSTLQAASAANTLSINVLSAGAPQQPAVPGTSVLNEMLSQTTLDSYTLTNGGEYSLALVGSPTTVTGSAAGSDTVFAGGDVTFNAKGANDQVSFIAGSNVFFGDASSGDIVTGGVGSDSIFTGSGSTTVFSGAGHTQINLGDSASGGDIAYLGDGHSTVNAFGLADTVVAATNGQVVFGGSGSLSVIISDNTTSSGAAGDTITAGAGRTAVFDSVGGNGIFGASGSLTFVGEANTNFAADSIVAGSGTTAIFGAAGDKIDFATTATSGSVSVVAGSGNETLNGANAGSFSFSGAGTDSTSAVSVQGGTGTDFFSTGAGSESLFGGSGADVFSLNTVGGGGAHISIYDFSAADSVSVDANNQAAVASGTVAGGNYTITLSDHTTVTFVGITSLNGHII